MSTDSKFDDLHKQLFDEGLKVRRSALGDTYVDRSLANGSSEFAKPMQDLITEWCWGNAWTRPGLERKQRSLLNIGMLMALNRALHCTIYCGAPAGVEAIKVAEKVLDEMAEKGEMARELGGKSSQSS